MEQEPDRQETDLISLPPSSISLDHRSTENFFPCMPLKEKNQSFSEKLPVDF